MIMTRTNRKQTKNYSEICHGLSLCETYFVLYSWSSHLAFLESSKYYKIQNGRLAKSQKVIGSLADIPDKLKEDLMATFS